MSEMSSIVDFSADLADAKPPAPLPARDYVGEVRNSEVGTSKKSGKRQFITQFYISADQYPPDFVDGNPDGTVLTTYTGAEDSPQGRWTTSQFLLSLGAPLGRKVDPNALSGLRARVTVEHETYEGIARAKITRVTKLA